MKRFLVFGVFFVAAAAVGFGLNLLAVSTASATGCDTGTTQYVEVCDDVAHCSAPLPHGIYICGTEYPGGDPCKCEFSFCTMLCENAHPIEP